MVNFRICAAGGLMGFWGIFRGMDIGTYMAYYGNMVMLKSLWSNTALKKS